MPPAVNAGDTVNFVNAGKVVPAVVQVVHESGHADLAYTDGATPTVARGIPWAPAGGSHGWQLPGKPGAAEEAGESADA